MTRSFSILQVNQSSPGNPGSFEIAGDLTTSFQGKFYRQSPVPAYPAVPATVPFYTSPLAPPSGYELIQATTFDVISNESYRGRYTVFTKPSIGGLDSSTYTGSRTIIRVNESIGAPLLPGDVSAGTITSISTYVFAVSGESNLVLPPFTSYEDRGISLFGRSSFGWGEGFTKNFILLAQNFAGTSAPPNPFQGQLWFDSTNKALKMFDSTWGDLNKFSPSYRFTQSSASTTWVVSHGLNLAAPYICLVQVFVNTGSPTFALPQSIVFNDANQLTITFSSSQNGYALIRP